MPWKVREKSRSANNQRKPRLAAPSDFFFHAQFTLQSFALREHNYVLPTMIEDCTVKLTAFTFRNAESS